MQNRYNPVSGEFDLIEVTSTGTSGRLVKFGTTDDSVVNSLLNQSGNNIALDSGKFITSESGVTVVSFGTTGTEFWSLDADSNTYGKGWAYGDSSEGSIGFGVGASFSIMSCNVADAHISATDGTAISIATLGRNGEVAITSNDGTNGVQMYNTGTTAQYGTADSAQLELLKNSGAAATSINAAKQSSFLGAQNSTMASGVTNSAIIGGSGLYGKTNNTAYLNQIGHATGSTNETLVQFTAPTANRTITFEDATGRVIAASAVTTEVVVSDTPLTIVYNGTTYKLLAKA